jgi:hypothetical protein
MKNTLILLGKENRPTLQSKTDHTPEASDGLQFPPNVHLEHHVTQQMHNSNVHEHRSHCVPIIQTIDRKSLQKITQK